MQTPGPSNGEPQPICQGPSTTTYLEGPKTVGTLRVFVFFGGWGVPRLALEVLSGFDRKTETVS